MNRPETIEATAVAGPVARARKTGGATKQQNGHLSTAERALFRKYEAAVQKHFETFRPAGEALQAIRDKRLYRETHVTFEEYCREKWSMSKTQANRLIAAAKVAENIAPSLPTPLAAHLTESVVRPLAGLTPKKQIEAIKEAVKIAPSSRGITAKVVTAAAHKVSPASFKKVALPESRRDGNGDLVRRSEVIEALDAWRKEQGTAGKFEKLTPQAMFTAIKRVIRSV